MNPERSPLPWTLEHLPPYCGDFQLVDANGNKILVTVEFLRNIRDMANSHNRLLAANKALVESLKDALDELHMRGHERKERCPACDKAREALQQAGEM